MYWGAQNSPIPETAFWLREYGVLLWTALLHLQSEHEIGFPNKEENTPLLLQISAAVWIPETRKML